MLQVITDQSVSVSEQLTGLEIRKCLDKQLALNPGDYYLIYNGKRVSHDQVIQNGNIHVIPRVFGGKGGFGSMLRAIGAQIEKTTNREACRDLSGRRLRDINEEQRLKNWINQQAEREKETKERRKKKLERLCERPKHEFQDETYIKERSELPEMVEDAVLAGLQASCTSKRKCADPPTAVKKKPKLWVDDELDEDLSSSDDEKSESEDNETRKKPTVIAESSKNPNEASTSGSKDEIEASTSGSKDEDTEVQDTEESDESGSNKEKSIIDEETK